MIDNTRRTVSLLLLLCLFSAFAALPVRAAEVTRPAVTEFSPEELVEPDENRLGVSGGPAEDTQSGQRRGTGGAAQNGGRPQDVMTPDAVTPDGTTDRMPGEYNADENGMVAGATDEAAWTNWVVWGIVAALLVAAAIVAGVVFLVPAKDED